MELSPEGAVEIELLKQIGNGDRRSFQELYERFSGILFSIAYRTLNSQEAAEEVIQDVFVQIWEKAPLYDPARGKPITWAVTLTRNKSIDRLRSNQRRARLHDSIQEEAVSLEQFDDRNSFEAVASDETSLLVREAMEKLPADQREAISLAFLTGLTQSQIAERLDQPLGTVKARIRRGMMKLRDILGPGLL